MTPMIEPAMSGNDAADLGRSDRTRLEQLLEGGCTEKQRVIAAVQGADDAELTSFGLRAYQMNLLSLFGAHWSREKIAATARAATISKMLGGWEYHHHYLPSLAQTPNVAQIEDAPIALIADVLARGRGLVVATFHLGPMRHLPSDLAHAGIPICLPLATDSFNDYRTARDLNPRAALWSALQFVNVEERGGAIALARTLARGGCVLSTIDGNTGLDGPRGEQRRACVRILDCTARVKTGLIGLAARFGAPVLVLAAFTIGDLRLCRTGPLLDPGGALSGNESEQFVRAATQSAYSFFGAALRDHADEWSGGDLFHQWRLPTALPQREPKAVERMLAESLGGGGQWRINDRRIIALDGPQGTIWSDAVSGKCYRLPAELAELGNLLTKPEGGVGLEWLDRCPATQRSQAWTFLRHMACRDAIQTAERSGDQAPAPEHPESVREIARLTMHEAGDTKSNQVHQGVGWR